MADHLRRRRRISGLAAGTTMAIALALVAPIPVAATFWSSVPASQIASKCVGKNAYGQPTIAWRGGTPGNTVFYPNNNEPHGTMYLCYITYRLGTKTADGDYYAVDLYSTWQGQALFTGDEAKAIQYVESSKAPKDSVWGYTHAYTSTHSCTTPVGVGFTVGPISISTTMSLCSGTTVSVSPYSMWADWWTDHALNVRTMETSFFQKVPHGAVPTWTIIFDVPYYTYTQVGAQEWQISRAWHDYVYTVTGTV